MLDLYSEFERLIAAMADRQIEYALCGGLALNVVSRDGLILLKMMRDSEQDRADIAALREGTGEPRARWS